MGPIMSLHTANFRTFQFSRNLFLDCLRRPRNCEKASITTNLNNHCDCATGLRSGPPAPGQKFSTYYVKLIQEWYQINGNVYSRCKIKAVPSNSDVLQSVDDTIHLDIITIGYGPKEVIELTLSNIINF